MGFSEGLEDLDGGRRLRRPGLGPPWTWTHIATPHSLPTSFTIVQHPPPPLNIHYEKHFAPLGWQQSFQSIVFITGTSAIITKETPQQAITSLSSTKFFVSLFKLGECAGAVIGDNYVVTAAHHCVCGTEGSQRST